MKGDLSARPTFQHGDSVWVRGTFIPVGGTDYVTLDAPGHIGFMYTVNDMYRVQLESGGNVQVYVTSLRKRE